MSFNAQSKPSAFFVFFLLYVVIFSGIYYEALAAKPTSGPDQVVGLKVTVTSSQLTLSWDEPNDNGSAITGYKIERKYQGPWTIIVFDTGNTSTSYFDTGLNTGTTYWYRISAINANGVGPTSDSVSATTFDLPTKPRALDALVGDHMVNLSWKEPVSDGGTAILDYVIEISSDNGQLWNTFDDGISTAKQVSIGSLENNRLYIFRVSAKNISGIGPYSEISAMPTGTSNSNYEREPPKIRGVGFYQIETDNISDTYSKILLGSTIDDSGFFQEFIPYSTQSDIVDQKNFGGFDNYEKRGHYLSLDTHYLTPPFFGKIGKPIQIQVRLEDQFASTKIEHLSLYTANQNSDKSSSLIELNWNKGQQLSVIDKDKMLQNATAYESLENGFLWVVFDLIFQKEVKDSDIFLETWNEGRKPNIKVIYDPLNVLKFNIIPKQQVSLRVDVDISHDTSNPVCKVSRTCFVPNNAQILRGGVISWINNDSFLHDVESGTPGHVTNEFDLHIMPGDTIQKKFEQSGVFPYFCRMHPWATGMVTVISENDQVAPIISDSDSLNSEKNNPVLLVSSETSSGSVMVENNTPLILPNKDLTVEISGHIKNKKKNQPLEITILKPDNTLQKLHTSTVDKGYYFVNAKLDKKWQEGEFTITTFYKYEEIASITFTVHGKDTAGFGGILHTKKIELENKLAAYIDSTLSLDDLDLWMKENDYDQKFIKFIHKKFSVFGFNVNQVLEQ